MVNLGIHRKRSGVPVLSRKDIDVLGEKLVADFCPDALKEPQALDVDSFAQNYLGMEQDYQYLSHCGVYLGMTVFNDTNKVAVYNPAEQRAEYISARAGTIIIDNTLLEENQEHRYRFTMGHEAAGHGVLHEPYFHYDRNQMSMFDEPSVAMIQCRTDGSKIAQKEQCLWDDRDWMEWQANAMASAFLMPKSMVLKVVEYTKSKFPSNTDPNILCYNYADAITKVFNVSFQAATYRLKQLGVIRKELQLNPAVMDFLDIFNTEGIC